MAHTQKPLVSTYYSSSHYIKVIQVQSTQEYSRLQVAC